MEQNRPFKRNLKLGDGSNEHVFIPNCREPRDDDYYERAFSFCKKYGYGFHPMVYSKGIDLWKKNFVWFQEMFKKHDLKFNSFMLLEVRNEEWTSSEAMELAEFTEFAVNYIFKEVFKENKAEFLKALRQTKILNTLFDSCVGKYHDRHYMLNSKRNVCQNGRSPYSPLPQNFIYRSGIWEIYHRGL